MAKSTYLSDTACRVMLDRFIRTGNPEIKAELVSNYARLCDKMAWHYAPLNETEREEIRSECILGILEALDTYDESKKTKLMTWVTCKVLSRVRDYSRERERLMPIPRSLLEFNKKRVKIQNELYIQLERTPSHEETAHAMGIPYERYVEKDSYFQSVSGYIKLDKFSDNMHVTITGQYRTDLRLDFLLGKATIYGQVNDDFRDTSENTILSEQVFEKLQARNPRWAKYVRAYFFGDKGSGQTFKQIGQENGISETRVYQLVTEALAYIRSEMNLSV